jgi:hypothetical protein
MICNDKTHTHVWLGYDGETEEDTLRCLQCGESWYVPANEMPVRDFDRVFSANEHFLIDALRSLYDDIPVEVMRKIADRVVEIKDWYYHEEEEQQEELREQVYGTNCDFKPETNRISYGDDLPF